MSWYGPATGLIRVKASSEHEPRKSRIRALARALSNYMYLFGLIDCYLYVCRNGDTRQQSGRRRADSGNFPAVSEIDPKDIGLVEMLLISFPSWEGCT
jgi:hypothetical protein